MCVFMFSLYICDYVYVAAPSFPRDQNQPKAGEEQGRGLPVQDRRRAENGVRFSSTELMGEGGGVSV